MLRNLDWDIEEIIFKTVMSVFGVLLIALTIIACMVFTRHRTYNVDCFNNEGDIIYHITLESQYGNYYNEEGDIVNIEYDSCVYTSINK